MIDILSLVIYAWCIYTMVNGSSAYADYMGTPTESESDDTDEAGDEAADEENDEGAGETD